MQFRGTFEGYIVSSSYLSNPKNRLHMSSRNNPKGPDSIKVQALDRDYGNQIHSHIMQLQEYLLLLR